jgi:hypothetical protein
MIGLILFGIVGLGLFVGFLFMGLQGAPKKLPDSSAVTAVVQMVSLEGSSFTHANRLLDDADYEMLRSHPALQQVAKQFRKDRQELALLWVSVLLSDLGTLWRFRRFLIQQGAPARLGEELDILRSFVVSVIFLNLLKALIHTSGPFVFLRMTRRAGRLVDRMSYAAASALGRIPAAGWAEVERSWTSTAA